MQGRRPFKKRDEFANILANHQIKSSQVRLINQDGDNVGIVETKNALNQARNVGLDLVCISDKSTPPVCKIIDYSKYKYELKKQKKEQAKRQRENKVELKEIQLRPVTADGDLAVKVKKINEFIANGDMVKVVIKFRGREMAFKQQGFDLMQQLLTDTPEAKFQSPPSMNGRNMIAIFCKK